MKILYVATLSNTINAFMIPHIQLLINQGHQVDLACNIDKEISPILTEYGCNVFDIKFQRTPLTKQNYLACKKLKSLIKKEKYDLIHTHTPVASFCVRLVCMNLKDVKVIYTVHGFHFFKEAPLKSWLIYYSLEKIAAHWTDGILTMNEEDYINAQKLKLRKPNSIYCTRGVGINLEKFKPQNTIDKNKLREYYGYKESDFILIYVGELSRRKNQKLLINALSVLKDQIPNIKLLLVGSGPLELDYKKHVFKLGLVDTVEFLGYRTDVPNLMALSDIGVSSSRQEGLPVNIMEAMATGLPLIVADSRGNRDLVKDGENGFVVSKDNTYQFADAISRLYASLGDREYFGASSLNLIESYSQESVLKELKAIYSDYL